MSGSSGSSVIRKREILRDVNGRIHEIATGLSGTSGVNWDFVCECGQPDCAETVTLASAAYSTLRDRSESILAPGHSASPGAQTRRVARGLREETEALRAQARQQAHRAARNVDTLSDARASGRPARTPAGSEARTIAAEAALARLLKVVDESFAQRAHLERALVTKVDIAQAKGILSERLGVTLDEAFDLLRQAARSSRTRLHDIARAVIQEPATPPQLLAA